MKLTIPETTYQELQLRRGDLFVKALFEFARELIQEGGEVVIQSEPVNAPAEVIRVINTQKDLETWRLETEHALQSTV